MAEFVAIAHTTLSVTTATARVALPSARGNAIQITNPGASTIFVNLGGSTVTAALTSMPILPGAVQQFRLAPDQTHIAGIIGTGTGTIHVTGGHLLNI